MIDRLAAWVHDSIDWHGFARTRGGFTAGGLLIDPPDEPPPDAIIAHGGLVVPFLAARWDPWIEWHPSAPSLVVDLPTIRAPRGGIRYTP
jgi:hypothetical protein